MCVIFVAAKTRPTDEMVKGAWETNDAGGGVAWRETDKEGNTIVHWKKGIMNYDDMAAIIKKLPFPFVAHFRIPSQGGKRESLCHPFPIEKDVPLNLEGSTYGDLLFHNGHWNSWRHETKECAGKFGVPLPTGKWSDTRGMAFCASVFGVGFLEFIDEKAVAFSPDECELFGGPWKLINDIWCSNDFFLARGHRGSTTSFNTGHGYHTEGPRSYTQMCCERSCTLERNTNSRFCHLHGHLDSLGKKLDKKDDKKEDDPVEQGLTKVEEALDSIKKKTESGGGDHKLLPFPEIDKLYRAGARTSSGAIMISKNLWKKSRKKYQKEQRQLLRSQKKLAMRGLQSMGRKSGSETLTVH